MVIGEVTNYFGANSVNDVKAICLLPSATATNGPPTRASDGLGLAAVWAMFGSAPIDANLVIFSTAGSATMTATFRLWGYHPIGAGYWVPLGPGADATKGVINSLTAVGETSADAILHSEPIALLGIAGARLYLEITAIGGTSTAVEAHVVCRRGYEQ